MKVRLKRNGEEVEIEAEDDLLDKNPWYRELFERQIQFITEQFYDKQPEVKP